MSEARTCLIGNITGAPELRFTASGQAVCNFTVAQNRRRRSVTTGDWEDEEPLFLPVTAWGGLAEHVAESCSKGTRVVIEGRLVPRSWQADDGSTRRVVEVVADEVAVSLRWATAAVTKVQPVGQANRSAAGVQ